MNLEKEKIKIIWESKSSFQISKIFKVTHGYWSLNLVSMLGG
jgi:hypothetical protein